MAFNSEIVATETKNTVAYEHEMKWELNNVSQFEFPGYKTPIFYPTSLTNTRFYLEVWYYSMDDSASYINVTLIKVAPPLRSCSVEFEYQVSLYYTDSSLYKRYKSLPEPLWEDWSSKQCIREYTLLKYRKSVEVRSDTGSPKFFFCCTPAEYTPHGIKLKNDTLLLECVMKFSCSLPPSEMYHEKISSLNSLSKLTGNMVSLFNSCVFSDVVIRTEGKPVSAHRCILAAHSPVFKKEMEHSLEEAKTITIVISDYDPNVVRSFIKFLYSAEIEDRSIYSIRQHYMLARKYEVWILKQECVQIITESFLTVDCICGVLKMALDFDDDAIQRRAIIYASDHIVAVAATPAWKILVATYPMICFNILASTRFSHNLKLETEKD